MHILLLIQLLFTYLSCPAAAKPPSESQSGSPSIHFLTRSTFPSEKHSKNHTTPITQSFSGLIFTVPVQISNQTFNLILDTGSSNLWVISSNFTCISSTSTAIPLSSCNISNDTISYNPSTFKPIPNATFSDNYGSGEFLSGSLGYTSVSISGLTVSHQEIGVATSGFFEAPPGISGLLGIAYPSTLIASDGHIIHTFFENLYTSHIIRPFFSLAINRLPPNETEGDGGYLVFGGLPPVPHDKRFARAPLIALSSSPLDPPSGVPIKEKYSVLIHGVGYGTASGKKVFNSTKYPMIIDSGTAFNSFPPSTASSINDLFAPPAIPILDSSSPDFGKFTVGCNADPPVLSVKIDNQTFYHDARDMVVYNGKDDEGNDECFSAVISDIAFAGLHAGDISILGDPFLKSVIAVFDVSARGGEGEMRFAKREQY